MSVIRWILTIAIIAVSMVMTVVIWGKNKGRSMEGFLEKFTTGLVVAFFLLAILLDMQLF